MVKVREDVDEQRIREVFAGLAALKVKIPGILDYSEGTNNSPEGIARGYTHGFVIDFADEASRDAYIPHPEHQAVVPELLSILTSDEDQVLVFDYII